MESGDMKMQGRRHVAVRGEGREHVINARAVVLRQVLLLKCICLFKKYRPSMNTKIDPFIYVEKGLHVRYSCLSHEQLQQEAF